MSPTPYFTDDQVTLYHGDFREKAAKRLSQGVLDFEGQDAEWTS